MTIAELLVQTITAMTTAPAGSFAANLQDATPGEQAHAIVAEVYGEPCDGGYFSDWGGKPALDWDECICGWPRSSHGRDA